MAHGALDGLDAAARPLVADYIARHWVFVVGSCSNGLARLAVPRPMRVGSHRWPPHPMKLTALANTTTHVESRDSEDQAVLRGSTADGRRLPEKSRRAQDEQFSYLCRFYFTHRKRAPRVGYPDVAAPVGTVAPRPSWWPTCRRRGWTTTSPLTSVRSPFSGTLSIQAGRGQIAWALFCVGTAIFLIPLAALCRGRRHPTLRQSNGLLAGFLAVGIVAAGAWQFLPTVPVHTFDHRARFDGRMLSQAAAALAGDGYSFTDMTPDRVAAIPQLLVDRGYLDAAFLTNPFTASPWPAMLAGTFRLRTIGGKTNFCTYDEDGIESRNALP